MAGAQQWWGRIVTKWLPWKSHFFFLSSQESLNTSAGVMTILLIFSRGKSNRLDEKIRLLVYILVEKGKSASVHRSSY